jgi:hypothetical protein
MRYSFAKEGKVGIIARVVPSEGDGRKLVGVQQKGGIQECQVI